MCLALALNHTVLLNNPLTKRITDILVNNIITRPKRQTDVDSTETGKMRLMATSARVSNLRLLATLLGCLT